MMSNRDIVKIIRSILIVGVIIFCIYMIYNYFKNNTPEEKRRIAMEPVISKIKIDPPDPVSTDFIRAVAEMAKPVSKDTRFSYSWYVNGKEIKNNDSILLEKSNYKKGDKVYCRVWATREKYRSDAIESDEVIVKNSPPVLALTGVEPFNVPGRFIYKINATDPDGDILTYRLISPLNKGIQMDGINGEIIWDIPASMGESTGVRIVYEVKDSSGAIVSGTIDLNLSTGSEITW